MFVVFHEGNLQRLIEFLIERVAIADAGHRIGMSEFEGVVQAH